MGITEERTDVSNTVGRLVEIRATITDMSPKDMADFRNKMKAVVGRFAMSAQKFVVCTDMRGLKIISPDTAKFMVEIMRADNALLERSAIVLSRDATTFGLQIDRVMGVSGATQRKRFYDPTLLTNWLGETLNPAELKRLNDFLSTSNPGS